MSNKVAYTSEHKSPWNSRYTNTLTPILDLPTAYTKLELHSLLDWKRQNDGSKKAPKCKNTGAVFGQARVWTSPCQHRGWGVQQGLAAYPPILGPQSGLVTPPCAVLGLHPKKRVHSWRHNPYHQLANLFQEKG